jgi:hypothetical protein
MLLERIQGQQKGTLFFGHYGYDDGKLIADFS